MLAMKFPYIWMLSAFLFFSCVQDRPLDNSTVTVHASFEPNSIHITNDQSSLRSHMFMYTQRTLTRLDLESLVQIPLLTEDVGQTTDGITFRYRLREDVRWDDGSPLSMDDVIFTIKMNLSPLSNNGSVRGLFSSVIKDAYPDPEDKSVLVMESRDVHFGNDQVLTEAYIMQASKWDPDGLMDRFSVSALSDGEIDSEDSVLVSWFNAFNGPDIGRDPENMGGLGPYKVTQWESGQFIKLERKEDWWGADSELMYDAQYPEQIVFKFLTDDNSASTALQNQSVDVSGRIATKDFARFVEDDAFQANYHTALRGEFSYTFLGLNCKPDPENQIPFFENANIRRAIAHLTPVEEIIETVLYGIGGERQLSMVSPYLPELYNTDLEPIALDVEKAKTILDAENVVDTDGDGVRELLVEGERIPFEFKLNYMSGNASTLDILLLVQEYCSKAGIEIIPNPMEFGAFWGAAMGHQFDALMGAWSLSAAYTDPYQLWHSENWENNGFNICGFGDAYSDSLIQASNRTLDVAARNAMMKELQRKVYDDQPYIFLYASVRKMAVHKRFQEPEFYSERPGFVVNTFRLDPQYSAVSAEPSTME
jgi:peptide/nickel transport system substrate-binding protein